MSQRTGYADGNIVFGGKEHSDCAPDIRSIERIAPLTFATLRTLRAVSEFRSGSCQHRVTREVPAAVKLPSILGNIACKQINSYGVPYAILMPRYPSLLFTFDDFTGPPHLSARMDMRPRIDEITFPSLSATVARLSPRCKTTRDNIYKPKEDSLCKSNNSRLKNISSDDGWRGRKCYSCPTNHLVH